MAKVALPTDIYDQESVFSNAGKRLLTNSGLIAFSMTDVRIARTVPRIEVLFQLGDEVEGHEVVTNSAGVQELIACSWNGTFTFQPIAGDYATLCDLKAKTRRVMSHWRTKLDDLLPFFSVHWVKGQSSSTLFAVDKGYLAISLQYSVLFSLLPGSITELETP